ncbi:hypothetical protein [Halobacteriovorax sp. DA5]|uniref:hypothetical protein n=1 Tax=Halobacteriovorax sp. DA5 TaxID=2067553 RepID=UPI000CD26DEE|nr:hypothetical protein [Halobacteriovorax sp. DA5]POB12782.1 hypothetical protein C0Z22_12940 [Halobacteriovorax sp. DA5]
MLKKSCQMIAASYCLIFTNISTAYANDLNEKPAFPIGKINQLNANYTSPKGTGTSKEISIKGFGDFINPNLEVENYGGTLIFSIDNESFELDLSSLQINDAEKIGISNINYNNGDTNIGLNLNQVQASGEGFSTRLSGTSLECQKQSREGNEYEQLLQNCFNYLSLNVGSAFFQSSERSFYNLTNEYETLGSAVEIDDLKLNIRGGKFDGHLKGNVSKGVKVKFEGRASYDLGNKIVNIRIDKAKAGLFNVRRTIFKELERFENDKIEIDEPNIYIILQE